MAGAIIGACSSIECNAPVQDRQYVESEASRLAAVARNESGSSFRYPDLRSWKPARSAIDAIANADGRLVLDGIGRLKPKFNSSASGGNGEELRWFQLEFGQTILARVREVPRELLTTGRGTPALNPPPGPAPATAPRIPDLFSGKADRSPSRTEPALTSHHQRRSTRRSKR